jgi:hypothetical protein
MEGLESPRRTFWTRGDDDCHRNQTSYHRLEGYCRPLQPSRSRKIMDFCLCSHEARCRIDSTTAKTRGTCFSRLSMIGDARNSEFTSRLLDHH